LNIYLWGRRFLTGIAILASLAAAILAIFVRDQHITETVYRTTIAVLALVPGLTVTVERGFSLRQLYLAAKSAYQAADTLESDYSTPEPIPVAEARARLNQIVSDYENATTAAVESSG
jgi:hypothetical protein